MLTVTDSKHDWAAMPLSDMAFGNAMDCDFTLRSWNILRGDMSRLSLNHVYDNLLKDIVLILAEVENTGIEVDVGYLSKLEVLLAAKLEELETELNELSPLDKDINPNSTNDLGAVLFGASGFNLTPVEFSQKTKAPQITEAHLEKVMGSAKDAPIKFIKLLLDYKSKAKQYKTYVKGVKSAIDWNDEDRIYSQYNFSTVVTGRLSCSTPSVKVRDIGKKGNPINREHKKGVSFHTLPRQGGEVNIRKLMKADKGKAFITADFSQAELRVLAQCCRDKNLIEAFTSGKDLHRFTASLIYGKPEDQITKEERQIAKSVSFLIVYGGGPAKLSQQIGRSIGYCKGIFSAYQSSFPRVFEWIQFVHKFIRKEGYSVSLFGRRRNLSNVASPLRKYQFRALRQGMNFVIQSSASDLMLHGIKRLVNDFEKEGVSAEVLATVHDSVEVQCDEDEIKNVVEIMGRSLTSVEDFKDYYNLDFVVPFEVDIEVGTSFGDGLEAEFEGDELINYLELAKYVKNA